MFPKSLVAPASLVLPLLFAGCASLPADLGRGEVQTQLQARGLTAAPHPDARAFTREVFAAPLSLDAAIQLALMRSPELRVQAAQLGIAAAEVYEAGRLSNPLLSIARLDSDDAARPQVNLGIVFNFTELLFLRARGRIADAEFAAAQTTLGAQTLGLAADVEMAYRRAAAAAQSAGLQAQLADGAEAGAELAQRFYAAGNLKRADLALEQATAAEYRLAADAAAQALAQARASLLRVIGIPASEAGTQWTLAETLSAPTGADPELEAMLPLARTSRLDLRAARLHADAVAARYGLTRRTAWLGEIELGAERERDTDGEILVGPTLGITLPLFDWGRGRKARGAAELQAAEAALAARELDVEHELRDAVLALHSARTRVERYRQRLIPARETVVEQLQLEQNYMLIDVFELLRAKQDSSRAYGAYIDALRDWWLARAELARALGRRLPDAPHATPDATPDATPAPAAAEPAPAAHQHRQHEAQP